VHTGENALRFYEFDTESQGNKTAKKKKKEKKRRSKNKDAHKDKDSIKRGSLHPIVASRLDDFMKEG
jgi:hypothetical protein